MELNHVEVVILIDDEEFKLEIPRELYLQIQDEAKALKITEEDFIARIIMFNAEMTDQTRNPLVGLKREIISFEDNDEDE